MVVEHLDQAKTFDGACGKHGSQRVMACTRISGPSMIDTCAKQEAAEGDCPRYKI